MTAAVAITNLILGTAYTSYGIMTLLDMQRDRRAGAPFSHFGAAWVTMAFTCGPHHLLHGIHVGFEGRAPGSADLVAVLIGLPVGVIWLLLRIEAFFGGRGDRFVSGTPAWLAMAPAAAGAYLAALISWVSRVGIDGFTLPSMMLPNIMLVIIYMAIGYFLLRTQLRNHQPLGGWSVSGLTLTSVFPTCAAMHGIWVVYASTGLYHYDVHGFAIDWLGVPAGLYFLWVVMGAYREAEAQTARAPRSVVREGASVG
ncbi:MAG TPA: hypothetical protein VGB64_00480 [Actinomycetota bacterium]